MGRLRPIRFENRPHNKPLHQTVGFRHAACGASGAPDQAYGLSAARR